MGRKDREISKEEAVNILVKGAYGVLSMVGADGAPYGVPVNYCYSPEENAIFFHCAAAGQKLDNIRHCSRVAFAVVGNESIVPDKFTTRYESVMVGGRASLVEDEMEKVARLGQLCDALAPGYPSQDMIQKYLHSTAVVRIDIETMSGKRNAG